MSNPRKKKSSRIGSQQTNTFHFLAHPLRLVNRKDSAAQEDLSSNTQPRDLTGGRRSSDREIFELYDLWLSLSSRERQVTYLACMGYQNDEIALYMGITVGTVKSYLQHIFNKMGVRSKLQLSTKFSKFDFDRYPP